jgi:hypothetical protein
MGAMQSSGNLIVRESSVAVNPSPQLPPRSGEGEVAAQMPIGGWPRLPSPLRGGAGGGVNRHGSRLPAQIVQRTYVAPGVTGGKRCRFLEH